MTSKLTYVIVILLAVLTVGVWIGYTAPIITKTYQTIDGEVVEIVGLAEVLDVEWTPDGSGYWNRTITVRWKTGLPAGTYTVEIVIPSITFAPLTATETFGSAVATDTDIVYTFLSDTQSIPSQSVTTIYVS